MTTHTQLKETLTEVVHQLSRLNRQLLPIDACALKDAAKALDQQIRPILWALRSVEENQHQQKVDRQT